MIVLSHEASNINYSTIDFNFVCRLSQPDSSTNYDRGFFNSKGIIPGGPIIISIFVLTNSFFLDRNLLAVTLLAESLRSFLDEKETLLAG